MKEPTDPRKGGGDIIDPTGDPHARGSVVFDARKAILVSGWEAAVAHTTSGGEPGADSVALLVDGRINRPPDDKASAGAPAEEIRHLHLLSWEAVAQLICELQALAARDGFDLVPLLEAQWQQLTREGLTMQGPEEES